MWEKGDAVSRTSLKCYRDSAPSEEEKIGRRNPGSFIQQIIHSVRQSTDSNRAPSIFQALFWALSSKQVINMSKIISA